MKFFGKIGSMNSSFLSRKLSVFMALILTLGLALAVPAQAGSWAYTGSMNVARGGERILLSNGKVLAAGGFAGSGEGAPVSICELYDPATGLWSDTSSMAEARAEFRLVRLADGRVLAVGGMGIDNEGISVELNSAEIYNPSTGLWSSAGSLETARAFPSATLLHNDLVLVAGGSYYDEIDDRWVALSSAELYNPGTNEWSSTGSLQTTRHAPAATLLPRGKVLVTGGNTASPSWTFLNSCELYDPGTAHWSYTGSLKYGRSGVTTLISNGKVLVAGGWGDTGAMSSCELYDPGTGLWGDTGSLITARQEQPVVLLSNGEVLTFGGYGAGDNKLASAELYNPSTGRWRTTGSLNTARALGSAPLLPNGKVLAAGGSGNSGRLNSAELYTPGEGLPGISFLLFD